MADSNSTSNSNINSNMNVNMNVDVNENDNENQAQAQAQMVSEPPHNASSHEPSQVLPEPMQNSDSPIPHLNTLNTSSPMPSQNLNSPVPPQIASSPIPPQPTNTTTPSQPVNDQSSKPTAPLELGSSNPIPKLTDLSTSNILKAMDEFDSSIPDAVVQHLLNVSGMQTTDQRIIRMIAIAAQKFIHEIVSDSLQHCKLRGTKKAKDKKYTLSIEDLSAALAEYGIEVRRQQYFN